MLEYSLVKLKKGSKVAINSDLHLNMTLMNKDYKGTYSGKDIRYVAREHGKYLLKNNIKLYILNGDLSWDLNDLKTYLNEILLSTGKQLLVRYTLGNHELSKNFSVKSYLEHRDDLYLKNNPVMVGNTLYFGTSGFFDGELIKKYDNKDMEKHFLSELNDRYFKKSNDLTINDCNNIVKKDIKDTEDILKNIEKNNFLGKKVFIMHYVPVSNFYNYNFDFKNGFHKYRNCFLGSDLYKDFIDRNNISYCYFGHNHLKHRNRKIGKCNYITEPTLNYGDWIVYNYEPKDLKIQWERSLKIIS